MENNMYTWIDSTVNFISGRCPHRCKYCYVQKSRFPSVLKKYSGKLKLDEASLKKSLGKGKTIFIQDCGDLFAEEVPDEWIIKILEHCKKFDNKYLFQSKNPKRFLQFTDLFPKKTILGTTIESDKDYGISKAPCILERVEAMEQITLFPKTVTIEPILQFDIHKLVSHIIRINPEWVNIGADSKNNHLPEPSRDEINNLINELTFTKVVIKDNLRRIK